MRITLTVTEGPHAGQSFSFSGHDTFLVGRSKRAHFRLPVKDRYFSRIHFLVEINPPQCRLMDMSSRNGTHVNGERVQGVALKDGDEIRAGKTVLRVTVAEAPVEAPVEAPKPTSPPAPEQTWSPPATPTNPVVAPVTPEPVNRQTLPAPTKVVPPPLPVRPLVVPSPASPPSAGVCRACGQQGPLRSTWLCHACDALSAEQMQNIPNFRLVKKLGQGAMGIVYLAVRQHDGLPVAMKTVTPAVAGSTTQIQRFLREAEILRQLTHPHIIGFCDMGEADGVLYFAMHYVTGRDASQILRKDGPFAVGRAVTLICQLLEALEFAHARGFVHRDIKPSNLLIAEENGKEAIKVVDFGLARVYQASQLSGLTLMGDIGGTLAFMPPEQITEYRDAKPPADQYASAATLYNLLTGAHIHDLPAEFHQQILHILQEDPVPIQKRRKDLPRPLCDAIHRALAREAEDRFSNVSAFREALLPFRGT